MQHDHDLTKLSYDLLTLSLSVGGGGGREGDNYLYMTWHGCAARIAPFFSAVRYTISPFLSKKKYMTDPAFHSVFWQTCLKILIFLLRYCDCCIFLYYISHFFIAGFKPAIEGKPVNFEVCKRYSYRSHL